MNPPDPHRIKKSKLCPQIHVSVEEDDDLDLLLDRLQAEFAGKEVDGGFVDPFKTEIVLEPKRIIEPTVLEPNELPGLEPIVQSLKDLIILGSCKGILLHGPPGVGKTSMARLVAKECNAHLVLTF